MNINTRKPAPFTDELQYLEDTSNPEVLSWLSDQAAAAEEYFSRQAGREVLRQEMQALFSADVVGLPTPRQGTYFFWQRRSDQDMFCLYVSNGLSGTPRLLIDENELSESKTTVVTGFVPSRDATRMAYMVSYAGNDKKEIRVMDIATGADLPDVIPDMYYPRFQAWLPDGTGFYYAKRDPRIAIDDVVRDGKFYQRIYLHRLGSNYEDDTLVFGEQLARTDSPSLSVSYDGQYLLAHVYGQDTETGRKWQELYLKNAGVGSWTKIIERQLGVEYYGVMHRGQLYLRTNEHAPNWHVRIVSLEAVLQGAVPTVCIPESSHVLEDIALVGEKMFVQSLENVVTVVREHDLMGTLVQVVSLPTLGSLKGFTYEREGSEIFFEMSSFAVPPSHYRMDLESGSIDLIYQQAVGFDVDTVVTSQQWCVSRDGTRVPMFVIHRSGLQRNGENPTVVYGYGGFDISLTPGFQKSILPFIKRGGVYVVANLRGGGEFGQAWHEGGMQKNKQNVFDDFAAVIEWLYDTRYTSRDKLCIKGGSNGGLLTSTIVTQRPDLVRAAIASVPVTDMLRYHKFFGGVYWIPDYGNPDDPEMRDYLLTYSPYHNVVDGTPYPAVLITTSNSDDRVHPMHSYKMAMRLQQATQSVHPVLLRVELDSGHGGSSAVSKTVEEMTDVWSFVFKELGMTV